MSSEEVSLKKLLRDINKGQYPKDATKVVINIPSGNTVEVELVFSPARFDGENCIQMMVQEIDANAVLKEELNRLRRTDPVTHLVNRKTFSEIVDQHIEQAQATDNASAVIYTEADGVRELRASLGVSGWDSFMIEFAAVIKDCIIGGDIAARIDDNGFALLVSRDDKSGLNAIGDRIVSKLGSHTSEVDNLSLSVTCSVGIAMFGNQVENSDEAIDHARNAFAVAAMAGNSINHYKPQLISVDSNKRDQHWVERIRYALDNHDLYSVQQSIVNLEGESEGLFESKTFLREEDHDLAVEQFLPIAERNDLGTTIDRYVISGLMTAIAGTGDRHIISLSKNSLLDFSFPSWFIHQLKELDVQGEQLVLQLSAPSVKENLKPAKRLIDELKPHGCGFSLSSFDDQRSICSLLDQLDISLVKLRPELTKELTNNSAHQDIVRKVVQVAESKRVCVVADDIHDAADLAVLWQCGVKLVAGDFLQESPQVVGQ